MKNPIIREIAKCLLFTAFFALINYLTNGFNSVWFFYPTIVWGMVIILKLLLPKPECDIDKIK